MPRQTVPWFALATLVLACRTAAVSAAPGDLDPSFGSGGRVVTDLFGENDSATALVVQPDGKIVVVGSGEFAANAEFAVVRYDANGTLDPSFGIGGKVATSFGSGRDVAAAVALQADAKLVVAGTAAIAGNDDFALARYNPDGTLDPGFGTGGRVLTPFPSLAFDQAEALVIQPDGGIVVAGGSGSALALARYQSDGGLDPSFGTGGLVLLSVPMAFVHANALVRQPDGGLVAAGSLVGTGGQTDFVLARVDASGALDPSFGTGGVATADFFSFAFGDFANALVLQSDGGLVAAGRGRDGIPTFVDAGVARFLADGSLDPAFASAGKLDIDFTAASNEATALALQPDGRIVVAGYTYDANGEARSFALARLTSDGRLDHSFGAGGLLTTGFDSAGAVATAVTLQSDGKVVAAGLSTTNADGDFALARYDAVALGCSTAPLAGCKVPTASGKALLLMKDRSNDAGDQVFWRWGHGAATTTGELGDPLATEDYVLCLYDESGPPALRLEVLAAAGGTCGIRPCWEADGARGFVYRDKLRTPSGLEKMTLLAGGAGRTKIVARAKGANLPPLALPLPLPVRVQIQAQSGACWEATYSAAGATRNDPTEFKGVSD